VISATMIMKSKSPAPAGLFHVVVNQGHARAL